MSLRMRDSNNSIIYIELHKVCQIDYLVYTEAAGLGV